MNIKPKRNASRRGGQVGFTLLETLVAIVVFSIGLLGVVGLQARSIQFAVDGEDRNRAALMADGIVAAMWARDIATSTLTPADRTAFASGATGGPIGAIAVISAPNVDGVVEVRITWRPPSRPASEPDSVYVTNAYIPTT
jgi:type IV pilus assembly protein PilV